MKNIRVGHGYDVHRLAEGLPMIIGGIKIDYTKGMVAHSDGDVLLHALCDALLGALALGDIGSHFPDTSIEFKNIDSTILLERTYMKIREKGYVVGNIDMMLTLENPKIKRYVEAMREKIAVVLRIDVDDVSIKATTQEGLGFVGAGQGIEATATILLFKE